MNLLQSCVKKVLKEKTYMLHGDNESTLIVLDKINFISFRDKRGIIHFNNTQVTEEFTFEDRQSVIDFWKDKLN